jgi:hypothetical protein
MAGSDDNGCPSSIGKQSTNNCLRGRLNYRWSRSCATVPVIEASISESLHGAKLSPDQWDWMNRLKTYDPRKKKES